jgi:hypothetical protein
VNVLIGLLWLTIAAGAQEPPASPAPDAASKASSTASNLTDTVEVNAEREALRNKATRFVSTLVRKQNETLTRWSTPICPSVAGMSRDLGEFVLARISQAALEAGAPLDGSECRANLFVILTDDPRQLVKTMRKRNPGIFGEARPAALDRFMNTSMPVRAWYSTTFANEDGTPPMPDATAKGRFRLRDSRIVSTLIEKFSTVIVVVDNRSTREVKVGQLADYVAMVGLAQVDPNAEFEAPTILHVFADPDSSPEGPGGLTEWDRAFLRGLYRTSQGALRQRSLIVNSMMEEMSP